MPNVVPTKGNMMAIKRSLSLARLGYDLMDRKRNILIREMMGMIDRANELQEHIDGIFRSAYSALQSANITLGNCLELAQTVPDDVNLSVRFKSIMGVEIPIVTDPDDDVEIDMPYGVGLTNSYLDEARRRFIKVKKLTRELAEVEISIYRLAVAIKKAQKRANALQNIIIPDFSSKIKFIQEALEEKEREEFVRLKVIKAQKM